MKRLTRKGVTTVTDYFWRVGAQWKLTAYAGSDPATAAAKGEQIDITGRAGEVEVKRVDAEDPPYAVSAVVDAECPFNWPLAQINGEGEIAFEVNRGADTCKTPRRNVEVGKGLLPFLRSYRCEECGGRGERGRRCACVWDLG